MTVTLYTIGHGTLAQEDFGEVLVRANIETLVDIRSIRGSRRNPQFHQEAMERWLPEGWGVRYVTQDLLGGYRKKPQEVSEDALGLRHPSFRNYGHYMQSEEFRAGMDWLADLASKERVAVMCSESVWWKCHRRLVSDFATLALEMDVLHLMHNGLLSPHVVTSEAATKSNGDKVSVVYRASEIRHSQLT